MLLRVIAGGYCAVELQVRSSTWSGSLLFQVENLLPQGELWLESKQDMWRAQVAVQ